MLYEFARCFALPVDALFEGGEQAENEDAALSRAGRQCKALIDRVSSLTALENMTKVLRAMSGD